MYTLEKATKLYAEAQEKRDHYKKTTKIWAERLLDGLEHPASINFGFISRSITQYSEYYDNWNKRCLELAVIVSKLRHKANMEG